MTPKYVEVIWLLNGILFSIVLVMSAGIAIYTFVQPRLARKRLYTLVSIKRHLRLLAARHESVLTVSVREIIAQLSLKQFMTLTKKHDRFIPKSVEDYWRDASQASGKAGQVETVARGARNKWRSIEALVCLGYLNTPHALDILQEGLYKTDEDISYYAMLALGKIKSSASAAILLEFLSEHPWHGQKTVAVLETFPASIAEEILPMAQHPSAAMRFWALKLLSKFRPIGCYEQVLSLTNDAAPDVRAAACECLGSLGSREAEDVLLQRLHDREWFVRMHAVRALSKVAGMKYMTTLFALLAQDDSPYVKASVKDTLVKDIDQAVADLEQYLRKGDSMTKKYCVEALVESNYISRILDGILSEDLTSNTQACRLLDALIQSRIYFGLKHVFNFYTAEDKKKILDVVVELDANLASQLSSA